MTAAAWRRAKLPPLAAALAIACLALLAWSATALADDVAVIPSDPAASDPSPVSGSDPAPDAPPVSPGTVDTPPPPQDTTPADPPPSDPAPQQPPSDPVDNSDPVPPTGVPVDRWDERPVSSNPGDTTDGHDSGSRSGSSTGSTPAAPPVTAMQTPSGLTPEGDLSLLPVTQFTVVPGSASTGGSLADAGLPNGGVRIGCLTLCPGGTRLAVAMRLALSRESRSAVREARARANGTVAKATVPSLFGLSGAGGVGLFNLLIGGGGSGAAIVFIGFLAVLMGLFALPRDWSSPFRLPAATWRPSAHVTPLELPG